VVVTEDGKSSVLSELCRLYNHGIINGLQHYHSLCIARTNLQYYSKQTRFVAVMSGRAKQTTTRSIKEMNDDLSRVHTSAKASNHFNLCHLFSSTFARGVCRHGLVEQTTKDNHTMQWLHVK